MPEKNTEIKKVVLKLIGALNPRNREVITRRFGLKTGKRETLESIGAGHGITRERVRQIEDASKKLIRESEQFKELVSPYTSLASDIIEKNGGVMRESELFTSFSGSDRSTPTNAALALVMSLDASLNRTPEDNDFHSFWSTSVEVNNVFKAGVGALIRALKDHSSVVPIATIKEFATKSVGTSSLNDLTLNAYLSISKRLDSNVFQEVGLTKWPEIKPRGVRDKSFLVLKREGKPKHFREITDLINITNFSKKKAHIQTVHNELIKDARFILVGRGLYALKDWGYRPGTVKDIIADIVSREGPMAKEKLVKQVMTARMVKPNTILLGIQDRKLFTEDDNGIISLNSKTV